VKYYVFLMLAPFHPVKEALRKLKLTRRARQKTFDIDYHPKVSVIIPAWNEQVGVIKTIQSIVHNSYQNIEVIVVNDGSTDDSHSIITRFIQTGVWRTDCPHVQIKYYYKDNGGKGTALNHGIIASTGDIILTVDADSALDTSAIARLVTYFADDTIDAAVGNVRVQDNGTLMGLLQRLEYVFGFYYKRAHSVMGAEYIFGGACAAFRKTKTFAQLGLFDTANKTEDIEMSLRTRYHGLHCVYAEDVVCYTEGASSVMGLINQRLRWKKGRFDTFAKYRRLFFSLDKRHNRPLSWFVLPYSLLSELQLLFEPIGITLLITYCIVSGDYLSLSLGILFILVIYLVASLFSGVCCLAQKYDHDSARRRNNLATMGS